MNTYETIIATVIVYAILMIINHFVFVRKMTAVRLHKKVEKMLPVDSTITIKYKLHSIDDWAYQVEEFILLAVSEEGDFTESFIGDSYKELWVMFKKWHSTQGWGRNPQK